VPPPARRTKEQEKVQVREWLRAQVQESQRARVLLLARELQAPRLTR
jgi:hypothetical protein